MPLQNRLPAYALPPPDGARAMRPASLVLFDGDVLAVWIRGRAVGFGGFPDERAAADAAFVAYAALSCWVDRRRSTPPPQLPATLRPTVCADVRDGERWVLADRLPIARLVDSRSVDMDGDGGSLPRATAARGPAEPEGRGVDARAAAPGATSGPLYGFEVEVPLPVSDLGIRGAAHAVYRALCRSGLPWRIWNAGRRARHVRVVDDGRPPDESPAGARGRTPGGVRPAAATPAHR